MSDSRVRPLRIVHIFRAPVGGLFRHVLDVTRAQIARGEHVGIFCDSSTGGEQAARVLDELSGSLQLGLRRVPMSRYPDWTDAKAFAAEWRHFREVTPDVIHGHGSKGGVYARLPAFLEGPGRPVRAYTPHGGSFNYKPGTPTHALYMGVERMMEWRTDLFLFESEYIADRFKTYVGETKRIVRVVLNGIARSEFEPIAHEPQAHDLVYVGELRTAKGVDTLIEAIALIRARDNRRLSVMIVGSGPDEALLKALAAERRLTDSLTFMGPAPIRTALAKGRVMVIPSRAESLPYVILEAAAAAQPLVSSNVGGISEIFGPHSARLIRPDDPTELARAILAILDLPEEERQRQADDLSSFVRGRFSLEAMVDGVARGYRAALKQRFGA